jgi:hypothetical protein
MIRAYTLGSRHQMYGIARHSESDKSRIHDRVAQPLVLVWLISCRHSLLGAHSTTVFS